MAPHNRAVVVFGIVLIVLGVAFILLGLAAAAREVFRKAAAPKERGLPIDPEAWEKLLRALTELVKVAPQWFLLTPLLHVPVEGDVGRGLRRLLVVAMVRRRPPSTCALWASFR